MLAFRTAIAAALGLAAVAAQPASAAMTLTAQGIALGFTLTNVVTGFPGGGIGPLGIAVNSDHNIMAGSSADNRNYIYSDTNNQTFASALSSTPFVAFPPAYAYSPATGKVYGSGGFSGPNANQFLQFNNDGSINHVITPNVPVTNGMWANPVNGHILAAGGSGIYDINVVTETARLVTSHTSDGITISADGTKLYTYDGGIFDIATGASLGNFGSVSGADGMGIITSSNPATNGDIVVNTTDGRLVLVDIDSVLFTQTVIASGGSRGDYTAADWTNGTLLLTQSNDILRLDCGSGCSVGSTPTPEPASVLLLAAGLLSLAGLRRLNTYAARR